MILMPISTWSAFKATVVVSKQLGLQYTETAASYEIYAAEASLFVWNICILKDGGSDVTDFETNYKSGANRPLLPNVSVQTTPPFGSKTIVVGGVTKKLYARNIGFKQSVNNGSNTITYTSTYAWVKMVGVEVINPDSLDTVNLKVYDDASGTYSGVPNFMLNQFAFTHNLPKDYYSRMAQFDADLYVGMVIEITYVSVAALPKTVGINLIMNEVKA